MGDLLIHHAYVQFYLLLVGVLWVVVLWGWWHDPDVCRYRTRPDRNAVAGQRKASVRKASAAHRIISNQRETGTTSETRSAPDGETLPVPSGRKDFPSRC
jgi:hypothetical protein